MRFKSFLKECREKEVFKMLSIYVVSAWVLIQVLAVTAEPLGLPVKSVSVLLILLIIGFPIYIFYIWKIRLAPLEKKKNLLTKKGKPKWSKFKNMYFSALTVIAVACAFSATLVFNNNFTGNKALARQFANIVSTDKIAIKEFGNNTGNEELDIVGKMASDWIMHGITEQKVGQVVTEEVVEDYNTVLKAGIGQSEEIDVLSEIIKPAKVITGNYYVRNGEMIMQASVQDGNRAETLISLPTVECDPANPLDCIEALKQRILVYFITDDQPELNLQDTPPKFEAYQYLLEAKPQYENKEVYFDLLEKSIAADSTYFEPQVLRVSYYYNQGEYRLADSLCKSIRRQAGINSRQLNLVKLYEAAINGNNDKSYEYSRNEYEITPFHLQTNASTMVLALQFVNKPEDVQAIYDQVDMRALDLSTCTHCSDRIYVKSLADIQLGDYRGAIELVRSTMESVNDPVFNKILASAFVRADSISSLDRFLDELKLFSEEDWRDAVLTSGMESLVVGKEEQATQYLDVLAASFEEESQLKANAYYYLKNYEEAARIYSLLLTESPDDTNAITRLAVSLFKNEKQAEATEMISRLDDQRSEFQFGYIDYKYAQYYAAIGDQENAFKFLYKAVTDGYFFQRTTFQNDPHFVAYRDSEFFKEILTFWH